ncbi:hypothetical protein CHS0354_018149 [Potamilus streckersoni]|uniref:Uncharacterized protein n=1 Tax=Potamilus streckersoni TaxID=2493646 RepID=A0AAE0W1D9_9BIVA|nr:hypothetical protein CHS0354_018149 [Potamilus streckersoni]
MILMSRLNCRTIQGIIKSSFPNQVACYKFIWTYLPAASFQKVSPKLSSENELLEVRAVNYVPNRSALFARKGVRKFTPKYDKDGVSTDYSLIYENNNLNSYTYYPPLTYLCVLATWCSSAYILYEYRNVLYTDLYIDHPAVVVFPALAFSGLLLLMVYRLTSCILTRIYHNKDEDKYIAVVRYLHFWHRKLEFTMSDVQPRPKKHTFSYMKGNILIKNQPFLAVCSDFSVPEYFNKMMGWGTDHPPEWLNDEENQIPVSDSKAKTNIYRSKQQQLKKYM